MRSNKPPLRTWSGNRFHEHFSSPIFIFESCGFSALAMAVIARSKYFG
jgi:hypothetical protein